jgi:hypothetical protein
MLRSTQKRTTHTPKDAEAAPRAKETSARERLAYRVPTLAEAFDLSPHFLRKEIRLGRLRAYKVGSIWIVATADAQAWLNGLPSNQAEDARNHALDGDQANGSGD